MCPPQAKLALSSLPWTPSYPSPAPERETGHCPPLPLISSARTNSYPDCRHFDIGLHRSAPWSSLPTFIGRTGTFPLQRAAQGGCFLLPGTLYSQRAPLRGSPHQRKSMVKQEIPRLQCSLCCITVAFPPHLSFLSANRRGLPRRAAATSPPSGTSREQV